MWELGTDPWQQVLIINLRADRSRPVGRRRAHQGSSSPSPPTPATRHPPAEVARPTELVEAGVLERVLLKADRSGAVLVLDVPDAAAARAQSTASPWSDRA